MNEESYAGGRLCNFSRNLHINQLLKLRTLAQQQFRPGHRTNHILHFILLNLFNKPINKKNEANHEAVLCWLATVWNGVASANNLQLPGTTDQVASMQIKTKNRILPADLALERIGEFFIFEPCSTLACFSPIPLFPNTSNRCRLERNRNKLLLPIQICRAVKRPASKVKIQQLPYVHRTLNLQFLPKHCTWPTCAQPFCFVWFKRPAFRDSIAEMWLVVKISPFLGSYYNTAPIF